MNGSRLLDRDPSAREAVFRWRDMNIALPFEIGGDVRGHRVKSDMFVIFGDRVKMIDGVPKTAKVMVISS